MMQGRGAGVMEYWVERLDTFHSVSTHIRIVDCVASLELGP